MSMKLPFLKEKTWPRIAAPMDEKSIGQSADGELMDRCIDELMDAAKEKNVMRFRSAVEALVLNMFEDTENAA